MRMLMIALVAAAALAVSGCSTLPGAAAVTGNDVRDGAVIGTVTD